MSRPHNFFITRELYETCLTTARSADPSLSTTALDIKLTYDKMHVLCYISPCLLVLSHAGEVIRSLITRGDGMQVSDAYFFCLDAEQNSLISDYGAHNMKIFSKDGTLLHMIGQEDQEREMLHQPRGIALTNNQNLVIVCDKLIMITLVYKYFLVNNCMFIYHINKQIYLHYIIIYTNLELCQLTDKTTCVIIQYYNRCL